jgi:acyl transferase domain-containing protein
MTSDERLREYLKRVTVDLHDTRRRLREIEQQSREPVAIVGMACRYPGGIRSPQQLWELVERGEDAISSFPVDRGWDLATLYHPNSEYPGACYAREGGFIYDVSEFDASFFRISRREALAMDPKQRLLLETSWEALEDADIDPLSLSGSRTGVFTGVSDYDYSSLVIRSLPSDLEGYVSIGAALSVASGRVAYSLGLEGPATSIDTACSSSLVALHLACGALRSKECTLALAGGATVLATPAMFVEFARQRGLAPDGRCKSFAQAADGAGWGEGVGVLLLELLSDAQRNGHRVLGVVRGSAVNQDGASNGLTAPNGPSQQRVIRQALASAGLSERQVDVVEAHGTGTTLGDPIEAQALIATYGADRAPGSPLWLGSIKSNIGHTIAAAGVAGVIKSVMAMRHRVLPKTLHVDEPSSKIDWSAGSVSLLSEAVPWERNGEPRRAGVSSFGMSGTNAHVIIEEAPAFDDDLTVERLTALREPPRVSIAGVPDARDLDLSVVGGEPTPWIVSARSAAALRGQAARLRSFVSDEEGLDVRDVANALLGRAQLEHRAVVVGATSAELIAGLGTLVEGVPGAHVVEGVAGRPETVFLFPGQGSQWVGMARALLDCSLVFRERMSECEHALAPNVDWRLQDVLRDLDGVFGLDRIDVLQPVLFAVMISLAELWRACGVRPSVVVGHSQGEVAAACVAGGLSLEDAARIVALRSRIQVAHEGHGGMMSIAAPQARVRELLQRWDGRIVIAAVNGPRSLVLAGESEPLSELVDVCDAEGIRARRIKSARGASHSRQVEPLREELLDALSSITPRTGDVRFCSTVTGGLLDTGELTAEYWYRNMREPVQFEPAVRGLLEAGQRTFIEVSPHPVLAVAVQETIDELADGLSELAQKPAAVIGTLRRDQGGPERFLTSLGEAWARGAEVDWRAVVGERSAKRVSLPTYAFQRERYWVEPPTANTAAHVPLDRGAAADAELWDAIESGDPRDVATVLGIEEDAGIEPLVELLPSLAGWRRKRQGESLIDSWRYRIEWKPIGERQGALSGRWLIVVPAGMIDDGCVVALTGSLRSHGAEIVSAEIDAATSVDRDLLAGRLSEALVGGAPGGVLSLLSLAEQPHPDHAGLTVGVAGTLTLIQALETAGIKSALWLVTREVVSVGANDPVKSPLQGMIWGLGCTLALEQPDRWGGLLDLPATLEQGSLARLCGVLAGVTGEDQLAVRSAGVFARRLRHAPLGVAPLERTWTPKGTALITGGTGAVAAHVARWLAQASVPHLLLVSRRGPQAPGAAELQEELEAIGTRVTMAACDASNRTQLQELLASIPEGYPLDAVFHAAGTETDCMLDALTLEQLESIVAPKARAALRLHELTEDVELSAFVLFSSMGATTGSGAQGHSTAANAVLDALADYRHARGLPATSVAWGSWAGEDTPLPTENASARRGVLAMDPQLALGALRQMLDREETRLTVASVDWDRYASTYTAARARPLIGDLPEVQRVLVESTIAEDQVEGRASALATQLAPLDESRRERVALELVRSQAAAVLGYATVDLVEAHRAFRELGTDSLMAVDLRNRLQTATGLRLPTTLVFDYPTPAVLARFLVTEATGGRGELTAASSIAVRSEEPIAIVGMSCRFPGGVRSPHELWELVAAGRDAIGEFPTDRGWDLRRLYDPDPDHRGTSYVCEGGFLHDVGDFDADFFAINPREALAMDPQQRMLLEACWEAFEDAGLDPAVLRGSPTGVYVGCSGQDYSAALFESPSDELAGYRVSGGMASMASGRISYTFGLEGPAVSVDTACSSSLVALHLGCQALRGGECSLALAAGVTVMSTPVLFVESSRQRGLAPDGRCKAFSDSADGTSFSDGVGVLVLERLSDARRLGHEVLALVRGSAVNQDGASNGLTAPNGPSQERVIRQALANSGLSLQDVDAVEAHGTGTMLGDPIEAHALLATYGRDRPDGRPLWLGSIKSNIGHTSAAAGVAGVIKMAMALRNGVLPRTLHVNEPSSHIDWSAGAVSLLTEERPWESNGRPRRAGVSSFGASGTNAHLILEEAPPVERPQEASSVEGPQEASSVEGPQEASPVEPPQEATSAQRSPATDEVGELIGGAVAIDGHPPGHREPGIGVLADAVPWLLSGKSDRALRGQAERLSAHVGGSPGLGVVDIGFSLTGRPAFGNRAVVLGDSREGLLGGLGALALGESAAGVIRGIAHGQGGQLVFLFPGQGAQWEGMAVDLLDSSPAFAEQLRACGAALAPFVDWALEDVLRRVEGAPGLERLDVVQPVLFAVMVSLAELWRACGVVPDVVVGHSQGEIAAACVAGALSLEDAARVVALRSRMLRALEGRGAMVSISAPQARVGELLERWDERIVVAAVNGPQSLVLAGENEALSELVDVCDAEGIRTRKIKGGLRASHSPQVEPLREELLEALSSIAPRAGDARFCSTVTGGLLDTGELGSEYWYRNMREPVQFEPAVRGLLEGGHQTFIEVSAHPVLAMAVQETIGELAGEVAEELAEEPAGVIGSLRRDQGGPERFMTSLGEAWVRGVEVDWRAVFGGASARRVSLPTYAFQRERYWFERGSGADAMTAGFGAADDRLSDAAVEADERRRTLPVGVLAQRVADAPEDRRHATALEFVLGEVAVVLGHSSPEAIDPKRAFIELGFDSLTALELRNRLSAATRLSLPNALVLDHPTSSATAAYIVDRLASRKADTSDAAADGQLTDTSPVEDGTGSMLTSLFREAHERGTLGEFTELLVNTSRFRPTFDISGADHMPEPVRLSEGASQPKLVCFPSVIAMSGPHEYARFARALGGDREVSVLPAPGYVSGQPLPVSFDVMVHAQAEAVLRQVGGVPFALVGYSSGGIVAHAVASHLESTGVSPAAVVLIDTYTFDIKALFELTGVVFSSDKAYPFINDVRLTAMGAYLGLLAGWKPTEIASSLLLASAAEPVPGTPARADWRSSWKFTHTAVEIPGHHFTIMEEHADTTARAVEDWLSTTYEEERVMETC